MCFFPSLSLVFTSLLMVWFPVIFFKGFSTWCSLRILNLWVYSVHQTWKQFQPLFLQKSFSVLALVAHILKQHFFPALWFPYPAFPGTSVTQISSCLLLSRSSLMLCPFCFVHPVSSVFHFRVFLAIKCPFLCNVQFPFNRISIFLISDTVFHP